MENLSKDLIRKLTDDAQRSDAVGVARILRELTPADTEKALSAMVKSNSEFVGDLGAYDACRAGVPTLTIDVHETNDQESIAIKSRPCRAYNGDITYEPERTIYTLSLNLKPDARK